MRHTGGALASTGGCDVGRPSLEAGPPAPWANPNC